MQLVGSPIAFIRGPFIAEGVLQGGLGAIIALALLWAGFTAVGAWWGPELGTVLEADAMRFLPARFCAGLVAGGMGVGAVGGFTASRHAV